MNTTTFTDGRLVEQTVDRTGLVAVQTPQVFELGLMRKAYAQKDLSSTDDAQLVERLGEAGRWNVWISAEEPAENGILHAAVHVVERGTPQALVERVAAT